MAQQWEMTPQEGEEMRDYPSGGRWPYCKLCGKWSSSDHRSSRKHICKIEQTRAEEVERSRAPPGADIDEQAAASFARAAAWFARGAAQSDQDKASLMAAGSVAAKLRAKGDAGFAAYTEEGADEEATYRRFCQHMWPGTTAQAALRRLVLVAAMNPQVRKQASHAGGIPPAPGKPGFASTPLCRDPGNAVYAKVVQHLLKLLKHLGTESAEHLMSLNTEHQADVMEAALAAADSAWRFSTRTRASYGDVRGGACEPGDEVTPFLVKLVEEFEDW
jgi:hypothetical protein